MGNSIFYSIPSVVTRFYKCEVDKRFILDFHYTNVNLNNLILNNYDVFSKNNNTAKNVTLRLLLLCYTDPR